MKVGIIVLCRYSSTRLPGKILMDFEGEGLLGRIISRLKCVDPPLPVIVATSTDPSDNIIERFCNENEIDVFRGSLNDVANRFLVCAKHLSLDYAIRINGDNLFTDPAVIGQMVEVAISEDYDLLSNVPGRTFPIGMSVEIVRTSFFETIYSSFNEQRFKEHVTLFLYENPSIGKRHYVKNELCPFTDPISLAIDTLEEKELAIKIIQLSNGNFNKLSLCEIIRLYRIIKNEQLER